MEELQVQVNAQTGTIECNFEELKTEISASLEEYRGAVFTDVSIKPAKTVVADLRKRKKELETAVKDAKKKYMEPFEKFKAQADEIIALYDEPINFINGQVEDYERRRKDEKRAAITDLYEEALGDLAGIVPLAKIYDQRWENSTYKMKDVEKDLQAIAAKITAELNVLDQSPSAFAPKAREIYLQSFDIGEALRRLNEYETARQEEIKKQQEQEIQRQVEEARKAEREKMIAEQQAEAEKQQAIEEAKEEALDAYIPDQTDEEAQAVLYSINVTPAEKKALELYMNSVGIEYTEV